MKRALLAATTIAGILAAVMVAPGVVSWGQGDVGKRPKEVLDPRTVRELTTPAPIRRLETHEEAIERQLARMTGQQQDMLEKLRSVETFQDQIVRDAESIQDIKRRLNELEQHNHDDSALPSTVAVLKTEVEGVVRVGWWIVGTTGGLLVSALGLLIKRLRSGAVVTMKWAKQDSEAQIHDRAEVKDLIREASAKSEASLQAANQVNEKLAEVGLRVKHIESEGGIDAGRTEEEQEE